MKNKLSFIFLLLSTFSFGQTDLNNTISTLLPRKEGEIKGMIGKIDKNFYALIDGDNLESDILHLYDENMKLTKTGLVGKNDKSQYILSQHICNDELYVLKAISEKKKKSFVLEKFDKGSLLTTNERTEVFSSNDIKFTDMAGLIGTRYIHTYSQDKSLFALSIFQNDTMYLRVYEKGLKLKYQKNIKLGTDTKSAGLIGFKITKEGNGALLYIINNAANGGHYNSFTSYLVTFDQNGSVVNENVFDDRRMMNNLEVILDLNDKIYITGMNASSTSYKPEELIYYEINLSTGKFENKTNLKFINPIFPEKLSYSEKQKAKKEDFKDVKGKQKYSNKIRVFQPNNDEYYFILQQTYIIRGAEDNNYYGSDHIFVHYYNRSTGTEWEELIPVSTIFSSPGDGSYLPIYLNNKLYILFNDGTDNADKIGNVEYIEAKASPATWSYEHFYASFDNKGFVERKIFLDNDFGLFMTRLYSNYMNSEYYIFYDKNDGKKYKDSDIGILRISSKQ